MIGGSEIETFGVSGCTILGASVAIWVAGASILGKSLAIWAFISMHHRCDPPALGPSAFSCLPTVTFQPKDVTCMGGSRVDGLIYSQKLLPPAPAEARPPGNNENANRYQATMVSCGLS